MKKQQTFLADTSVKKLRKPFYKNALFLTFLVILVLSSIILITMTFNYDVQVAIIRIICSDKDETMKGYESISQSVNIKENITYGLNFPNSYLDLITPKNVTEALPLVVYFHGGYYVGGDKKSKEPYCKMLASKGYIVANVNYVLAPDMQYPSQLLQANEAIHFLLDNAEVFNFDKNKVFIGGDSAGSHLSAQLGTYYTNEKLYNKIGGERALSKEQLKGLILLCGFYDIYTVRDTHFPFVADAMWILTGKKNYEENFVRVDELNIMTNATSDFPATFLTCGDKDPFYEQNKSFANRIENLGVKITKYLPTTTERFLFHEFQCDFKNKEAYVAMNKLESFLSQCCE